MQNPSANVNVRISRLSPDDVSVLRAVFLCSQRPGRTGSKGTTNCFALVANKMNSGRASDSVQTDPESSASEKEIILTAESDRGRVFSLFIAKSHNLPVLIRLPECRERKLQIFGNQFSRRGHVASTQSAKPAPPIDVVPEEGRFKQEIGRNQKFRMLLRISSPFHSLVGVSRQR